MQVVNSDHLKLHLHRPQQSDVLLWFAEMLVKKSFLFSVRLRTIQLSQYNINSKLTALFIMSYLDMFVSILLNKHYLYLALYYKMQMIYPFITEERKDWRNTRQGRRAWISKIKSGMRGIHNNEQTILSSEWIEKNKTEKGCWMKSFLLDSYFCDWVQDV